MDIFYPIQIFADWFTYSLFAFPKEAIVGEAVNFFIYDTIKIFILLTVIIFIVSIVRSFLPAEKVRDIVSKQNKYIGHFLASILGIITPFCSCSAVPLFIGFVEAGIPLGITFSFLIASPMINEVALVMLLGMFGLKIALLYILSGLIIAVVAGIIIGKLNLEHQVEKFVFNNKIKSIGINNKMEWKDRISYARSYTAGLIKKIWLYILIGIGVGAWIHGYVPADFLAIYAGVDKWYAVPLATVIGVPLYSNAAGIIPLVSVLTEKGVALGTTLAFMMAVTALSFPELLILKKVIKIKLIVVFVLIVTTGIIFTGYLFNSIL